MAFANDAHTEIWCPVCHGDRYVTSFDLAIECPECHGEGVIETDAYN